MVTEMFSGKIGLRMEGITESSIEESILPSPESLCYAVRSGSAPHKEGGNGD